MTIEQRQAVRSALLARHPSISKRAAYSVRPSCEACHRYPIERNERMCHQCLTRIDNADSFAESMTAIRQDMRAYGVPTGHFGAEN